ncbi:c-type cytochrome biogenesis protein CcmI [Cohaesibacter gelatinilyticus]|uniref:Cytochrome c-type biogenesis protein CcmH n=1 Tax=Cohaesibacter gelatinilyticus TaxID=372072 RepID=A0A285NCI0_9HYPH|nr:c-type cytochrome biogenesis protein CcmI [Cohaesibacter gelatinilyticus]SNZ07129.1 cytochrome c-type biogenesis protein CcmH [Cohaesibacter gelatinilyticus]
MFWIFAALLTALAVMVILYPLSRKQKKLDSAEAYDLTVYKSQLKEIDADVKRGLIAASEADAARAEVARRLIYTQEALDAEQENTSSHSGAVKVSSLLALLIVPVVGLGLYYHMGKPEISGQPLAERLTKDPEQQTLIERVASVERVLKANPDDIRGWKLIAPIYLTMRRPDDAIRAYGNVVRLEGETAKNLSDLGEALVVKEGGVVSQKAISLFLQANKLDRIAPKPRFFLAIALGQQDKIPQAIEAWEALISDSKPDSAWVPFAKSQIAALNKKLDDTKVPAISESQRASAAKGPTQEDIDNASQLDAKDRQAMIENMVSTLSERLESEGGSAEEWVQLIRAELVLKRPDKAAKTVHNALDALRSDVPGMEKVKAAARSLGLSINQ